MQYQLGISSALFLAVGIETHWKHKDMALDCSLFVNIHRIWINFENSDNRNVRIVATRKKGGNWNEKYWSVSGNFKCLSHVKANLRSEYFFIEIWTKNTKSWWTNEFWTWQKLNFQSFDCFRFECFSPQYLRVSFFTTVRL